MSAENVPESFLEAYRALEDRFRRRAEADGDVYIPNPEPDGAVDYIFVCMEPSLGRWSDSDLEKGRARVEEGIRNFLYSMEDYILHFDARRYLCGPEESYHITDISEGAMPTDRAGEEREDRFRAFNGSVNHRDLLDTAKDVLQEAGVPEWVRKETMSRLKRRELTTSRQKLLFIEKFEAIRAL